MNNIFAFSSFLLLLFSNTIIETHSFSSLSSSIRTGTFLWETASPSPSTIPSAETKPAPSAETNSAPSTETKPAPSTETKPAPRTGGGQNNQKEYGKSLDLPDTYVRCGKCQTLYALKPEDLGDRGKGRRLVCSTCNHSWFQAKDRLMEIKEGFELTQRPAWELERIERNLKENKPPAFLGATKLYVGNIAFECTEKDLYELFNDLGVSVGDVSLVRDDFGKNRGFGFVSLATKADGETAMEKLDGAPLLNRNIAVRESNN